MNYKYIFLIICFGFIQHEQRERPWWVVYNTYAMYFGCFAQLLDLCGYNLSQIKWRRFYYKFAGIEPRQIEQVRDKIHHPLRARVGLAK